MIHAAILQGLPPVTVRLYEHDDFDAAREIIHRIGTAELGWDRPSWERAVSESSGIVWTVLREGTPVAFAGAYTVAGGGAVFHTDLVDPPHQRQRIGTLLALVRFASLDPRVTNKVGVIATDKSKLFYQGLGFEKALNPIHDPCTDFNLHALAIPFTSELEAMVNAILDTAPVSYPGAKDSSSS